MRAFSFKSLLLPVWADEPGPPRMRCTPEEKHLFSGVAARPGPSKNPGRHRAYLKESCCTQLLASRKLPRPRCPRRPVRLMRRALTRSAFSVAFIISVVMVMVVMVMIVTAWNGNAWRDDADAITIVMMVMMMVMVMVIRVNKLRDLNVG
jgi:hypothetical protein